MKNPSPLLRHSDLLHRLVIDRHTTETWGRVEVVWMHPAVHRVMGFICRPAGLGKQRYAFKLNQIQSLGAEGIVVRAAPVETHREQVELLESLIGHELWSDGGNRLGIITDCLFDLYTGAITAYLFRSEGWRGYLDRIYQCPTDGIERIGKQRVLLADSFVADLVPYEDGLEQKVSKAAHRLTEQAGQRVQAIATQATEKAKAVGQSLTEELPAQAVLQKGRSLLEQWQGRVHHLGEELKAELQPLTHHIKTSLQKPSPAAPRPANPATDWEKRVPPDDLEDDEPWI